MDRTSASAPRLYLYPITLLALLLRAAIVALTIAHHPPVWFFSQASELGSLAHSLLSGEGFSSPFGGHTGPSAFLAPGYPFFIAAVFRIFGEHTTTSAAIIMSAQASFGAATVFVLMKLAKQLFGNNAANLAGMIWAVSPPLLFLPIVFWETSLSILLLSSIVLLALEASESAQSTVWIALGLVSLLALSINPSLASAIAGCFLWALIRNRNCVSGIVVAVVFALLFSIWPIRNERMLHAFIPLRSNLGYELWQGNRSGGDGFFEASLHPNNNAAEFSRYQSLGEVKYMREKSTLAKAAITSDHLRFTKLTLKRMLYFWAGRGKPSTWLMVCYTSLTTVMGLAGLFLFFRRNRATAYLLSIPLLLLPLPYYLTHPDYRFRCVIDPILVALSAYLLNLKFATVDHTDEKSFSQS